MYKYESFYEIYNRQLLETQALNREKPKVVGFYQTQDHPKLGSWLELYLGLGRCKDRVLLGFKLLKSELWLEIQHKSLPAANLFYCRWEELLLFNDDFDATFEKHKVTIITIITIILFQLSKLSLLWIYRIE